MFEKVLDYLYEKCLLAESKYHPVLFTEAPVSSFEKRLHLRMTGGIIFS